ncbi:hypothetical protein FA95DRAFT_1612735 [Auriscalpium vulgare]|uniref:Uncharacterized protein n=1 Tax=Auriscalpium vulgare TaxID=40419 RepID=A0ACB8R5R6_9AGAM|nr:hypothetical protein FA95DRAFT_1612735 [Auriscalpium vulgare]
MSIFAVAAVGSTGLRPVAGAGRIEANPHLQWRWIQWLHVIVTALCLVLLVLFMRETRTSVILTRRAKKLRAETGDDRYRSVAEVELPSLTLLIISCTRPLRLLLTEPVFSVRLVLPFACMSLTHSLTCGSVSRGASCTEWSSSDESIGPTFRDVHHFGVRETGTVSTTLVIGSLLGFATNFHQERLYHADDADREDSRQQGDTRNPDDANEEDGRTKTRLSLTPSTKRTGT